MMSEEMRFRDVAVRAARCTRDALASLNFKRDLVAFRVGPLGERRAQRWLGRFCDTGSLRKVSPAWSSAIGACVWQRLPGARCTLRVWMLRYCVTLYDPVTDASDDELDEEM